MSIESIILILGEVEEFKIKKSSASRKLMKQKKEGRRDLSPRKLNFSI